MKTQFESRFGCSPQVVARSPGRINLIGEHTDYNDGFVLPAAIDKAMTISVGLRSANGCEIFAADLDESEILNHRVGLEEPRYAWCKYVQGMMNGLGLIQSDSAGFNCTFGGDIPIGAGLSSSAALCVGIGLALNELFQLGLDLQTIAKLAQKAERDFAGVNCGLMDQYASLFGREGHFIKLDCRDLSWEYVPANLGEYALLLCDSTVKHALADSAYNHRRTECDHGLNTIRRQYPMVLSLRDSNLAMLRSVGWELPPEVALRCKYVIEENLRVQTVAAALSNGNIAQVGACMYSTHEGLQYDYEVSCAQLDFLVDITRQLSYVAGARLMGGGFGGCTLNLLHSAGIPAFKELILEKYEPAFALKPLFYEVKIGDGGQILTR